MRVIFRFVARLVGATLVTSVVLISLTATAAAARTHAVLAGDLASDPRLQPVVDPATTPWTVVSWLAAGLVLVAAAGVTLTVVGRLRTARVGRSGTSR